MKRSIKLLIRIIICLVMAPAAYAAGLTGQVVDRDGQPIVGVSVVTNVAAIGDITDNDGRFSLDDTTGVYRVTLSSVGYESRQFAVGKIPKQAVLNRTYYRGADITVSASRAEEGVSPVAFENVTRDEIERDYTLGDVPTLLNSTPNLYSWSDGGGKTGYTYTQIRGFDDKRIASYINGVPLNDPEDQYTYWVDMPGFVSSVSDIQVQRGVGNSLYGDASFGGAINVVSSGMDKPRAARVSSGYGEFLDGSNSLGSFYKQTVEYSSGLIDGRWAFTGRFSKQKSDGYRKNSWVDGWAYHFTVARLDPNMTTELQVFGGPMSLHLTYYGTPRDMLAQDRRFNPLTYEDETDNFNQPHFHLHNTIRLSDRSTLRNTLYFIRGDGWYEQYQHGASYIDYNIDTSFTSGAETGDLVRQQLVAKYQAGWNPRFDIDHDRGRHSLGGSFYYFESEHWGDVLWAQGLSGSIGPRHKYYQYFGKKAVGSIFAQEYYSLTEKLAVQATAQLRYQSYKFDQDAIGAFYGFDYDLDWLFFSPRLGLNYKLINSPGEQEAAIFANFAIASRTPTDAAIYDANDPNVFPSIEIKNVSLTTSGDSVFTFGDPTFRSERVYNAELGSTYRTPRYSFSVNFYWMDFKDEIISYGGVNPSTGRITTVNADGSYRAGIEISADYQIIKALKLSGNFSLNRYRIKDFVDTLDVYDASFNVVGQEVYNFENRTGLAFPEYLGSFVTDYRHNGLRATYRIQLVGKQYMDLLNIDSLAIDPHSVSTVSASYTLGDLFSIGNLTLSGTVSNLFDKKYEQSGYGWNYGYVDNPGASPVILGGAEYYVAAERSFFVEASLELY